PATLIAALAIAALALLASGAAPSPAAAEQPRLEIAAAGSSQWERTTHADWDTEALRPGIAVTSAVQLRAVDTPSSWAMRLHVEVPDPGLLLQHPHITSMS